MAKNQNTKKPKQSKVQMQDTEFSQELGQGQGMNNQHQQQGFNNVGNNKRAKNK